MWVCGNGHDHHGHSHGLSVSTHHTKDERRHSHDNHTHHHDEKHPKDAHHHTHEDHMPHHAHGEVTEPLLGESEGRTKKKQWNINVQGAYLHVLGDSIQSVGVMIGGAVIWYIPVGKVLLACQVNINRDADADLVLDMVIDYIRRVYNISHVTIQIER